MINYNDKLKDYKLHLAIRTAGFSIKETVNGFESSDDTAVQAIIDAYDPLSEAKTEAIARIKQYAATLIHTIYPHIDAEATDVIGFYNYTVDMWQGGALPSRLQSMKAIYDNAVVKIAEINAMADWQLVDTYDASVGW